MLWVILIGLVVAYFVVQALAKSRNAELEAGAAYESVQRDDPDSELAKMSESEFKLAYLKADKARRKAVPAVGFMTFFIVFVISLYVVEDNNDGETIAYAIGVSLLLAVVAGVVANAKLPRISSIMKTNLSQAAKSSKF